MACYLTINLKSDFQPGNPGGTLDRDCLPALRVEPVRNKENAGQKVESRLISSINCIASIALSRNVDKSFNSQDLSNQSFQVHRRYLDFEKKHPDAISHMKWL
jgi:hypothetical protein